ncbi:MAG: hypothetical protein AB7V53_15450 [Dongiaceae bacterium]
MALLSMPAGSLSEPPVLVLVPVVAPVLELGVSPAAMARPGAVIAAKSAMAAAVVKRRIRMMHTPVDDSRLLHQPRGLRSVPTGAGFVMMPGLGHEIAVGLRQAVAAPSRNAGRKA